MRLKALIAHPTDPTGAAAALGFGMLDWDVDSGVAATYDPDIVQVGDIRGLQRLFAWAKLPIRSLADPPQEIRMWLGREHTVLHLHEALQLVREGRRLFLKSVSPKLTDPMVFCPEMPQNEIYDAFAHVWEDNPRMIVQSPLSFLSEHRVMVNGGKIVAIRQYRGDPVQGAIDIGAWMSRVQRMVAAVSAWGPVACAVDVGIVEHAGHKQVVLVEINDAWALGDYGTPPTVYAEMLAARWRQIGEGKG